MLKTPRRRVVMMAKIQADSWRDLQWHLQSLAEDIARNGKLSKHSILGGYSSGHIIDTSEDETITNEGYMEAIEAYGDPDPARVQIVKVTHEIAEERRRQIEEEGHTHESDDLHDCRALPLVAAAYCTQTAADTAPRSRADRDWLSATARALFEWGDESWKPKDARRNLIRAAALLVAEIERLDRAAKRAEATVGTEEGDTCGRGGCEAAIEFERSENCSCHINPPCGSCESVQLHCPACGWRADEDEGEQS